MEGVCIEEWIDVFFDIGREGDDGEWRRRSLVICGELVGGYMRILERF